MKKFFALILMLVMTSTCFTSAASAANADNAAGKCLDGRHIVKIIRGDFSSSTSPQRVVVTRRLVTDPSGAACVYHINWEFYEPILRTWLAEGEGWTYRGPGLVFFEGLWQPQSRGTTRRLDVAPVQVLGKRLQLAIYRERDAPDGIYSDLAIYAITGGYGVPKALLHVANDGPLAYSVKHELIDIRGADSGSQAEVRLRYDTGAGQMAIVDPNEASERFYKSLLDKGEGFLCGTPASQGHGYRFAPCVR